MPFSPGLRLRLGLAAVVLAALALTAATIAVYGLSRTHGHAAEAMAAQRRIESYSAFSARVNDWMLGWLTQPGAAPDPGGVLAVLDGLDAQIAEDVAAAPNEAEATRRARQSVTPARLRGLFGQLAGRLEIDPPGSAAGDAAIAFYAAQAPTVVMQQLEQETRRRDLALAAMEKLQGPLLWSAIGVGMAAPIVLAALYLFAMRPLFRRLARVTASAQTMAMGSLPAGAAGHDELGLMLARLRQMARRIDRRRARLEADYGQLETIVAGRTKALSEANDRLAAIDASRRRFFADVGHELRTPLTVIMGEAELGRRHASPEIRAAFDTIENRAGRLFRRIEDLLRIARSESGQLELTQDKVALDQTVAAALADLAPVLKRAGIRVEVDLPPLAVAGDAEWLRQVFAGLFENAAKYAGRGAVVRVTGGAAVDKARVVIRDTGPGLPDDIKASVFERFSRGRAAPGFGVGLALAAWVVEASGGSLGLLPDDAPEAAGFGGLGLVMDLPLWDKI